MYHDNVELRHLPGASPEIDASYARIPCGQIDDLPGSDWQSGNMFKGTSFVPNCNMDTATFYDPVWKDKLVINDGNMNPVLEDIFYNKSVRRLQAVEQLTLPPEYSTIPNTGAFSRFEHIWGSALFVRQITDRYQIAEPYATELLLRTLVSDIGHTFGSHLGDWMFQGMGESENQHDIELASYLGAVGVTTILEAHGFVPANIIFPEVNDWVESTQPDLCVDRVDYGLREMDRWNTIIANAGFSSADFVLTPDNMLAMKDQQRARLFAEGFLLLSQEHWSEPTHRFILDMLMLRTKLFYGNGGAPRSWVFDPDLTAEQALIPLHEIHPRDLMYVTDPAQAQAYILQRPEEIVIHSLMARVAKHHRQIIWPDRSQRIADYMIQFDQDNYPDVLRSKRFNKLETDFSYKLEDDTGSFTLLRTDEANLTKDNKSIDLPLVTLKSRQVDPLVESDRGFVRLSDIDPTFAERLVDHSRIMSQKYVARLVLYGETDNALRDAITTIEAKWQKRLDTSRRMSPAELRSLVSVSAMEIFGEYPFMTFHSY
ncbi:MAG: hypothetical protein ABI220_02175 [Candidatus Saccharimonadales bacterium]